MIKITSFKCPCCNNLYILNNSHEIKSLLNDKTSILTCCFCQKLIRYYNEYVYRIHYLFEYFFRIAMNHKNKQYTLKIILKYENYMNMIRAFLYKIENEMI